MIKADWYYKNNLLKILDEGSWDENPRPKYKDGAPAFSKFKPAGFMKRCACGSVVILLIFNASSNIFLDIRLIIRSGFSRSTNRVRTGLIG